MNGSAASRIRPNGREKGGQITDASFKMRDSQVNGGAVTMAGNMHSNRDGTGRNGSSIRQDRSENVNHATTNGVAGGAVAGNNSNIIKILCGPLINYKGMNHDTKVWLGSILIVTEPGSSEPTCTIYPERTAGTTGEVEQGNTGGKRVLSPTRLYEDPNKTFWQFSLVIPLQTFEARWQYSLSDVQFAFGASVRTHATRTFVVPSLSHSMRIMFHSCNGFSAGTDEDAWSGQALWNDVNRIHEAKPFHVMIGGGDQIYNDGVRVDGPLRAWTMIGNPHKRRDYPFTESLRSECDEYYFNNYVRWYSMEPFATANAQIPQINIWDDHDIIDGFGSYTDHFMLSPVFRGIGGVSFKYYCLFQHHIAPPKSTFTTDAPQTMHADACGQAGADPAQLSHSFVAKPIVEDPSWIIGKQPGPYVAERSRSLYMRLGARMAFIGVDARTERTRHKINYDETYDLIFDRARKELSLATEIKHLIVLLGVPIAYPRLVWLENIFKSPIIGPIRFLNKRFGLAGNFFNHFDGQVDLLDDLDDHYTARPHKAERKALILRLQALSKEFGVRVTILGGDVHLAALGRFYSRKELKVPIEQDFRFMTNIISSAITNKPPPAAVANLLARRNKIHHFDHDTDETLLELFNKDPGSATITAKANRCTMPSRNFAVITETAQCDSMPPKREILDVSALPDGQGKYGESGRLPIHGGEVNAGTDHVVADALRHGTEAGALDVSIRVEIDQHDRKGQTEGYGFSIPPLDMPSKSR